MKNLYSQTHKIPVAKALAVFTLLGGAVLITGSAPAKADTAANDDLRPVHGPVQTTKDGQLVTPLAKDGDKRGPEVTARHRGPKDGPAAKGDRPDFDADAGPREHGPRREARDFDADRGPESGPHEFGPERGPRDRGPEGGPRDRREFCPQGGPRDRDGDDRPEGQHPHFGPRDRGPEGGPRDRDRDFGPRRPGPDADRDGDGPKDRLQDRDEKPGDRDRDGGPERGPRHHDPRENDDRGHQGPDGPDEDR